jgi:hypothetical protein
VIGEIPIFDDEQERQAKKKKKSPGGAEAFLRFCTNAN